LFLMEEYDDPAIVNVGSGQEVAIAELAALVGEIVGFQGKVRYNKEMPDGTPRKLLDVSRLSTLGWKSQITLREGVSTTYSWFLNNESTVRI
ncbi:MAG: GDP-L-fucose synthase, partial [Candidatus Electrothrix sp. AR4]|nr:GDP-L-fucose synthase [Candidatus Electrothrix sp. AR4]